MTLIRSSGLWICVALVAAMTARATQAADVGDAGSGGAPRLELQTGAVSTEPNTSLLATGLTAYDPAARYVVQFAGPLTPAQRAAVAAAGIELGQYLPTNAYIVHRTTGQPAQLAALDFVRWLGRYENTWKLAPDVGARMNATPERQALAGEGKVVVSVTLFEGELAAAQRAAIEAIEGANIGWSGRIGSNQALVVTMPFAGVAELVAMPAVQFVEEAPEATFRNTSNRWIAQGGVASGDMPIYDAGIHGEGQIVGVIDGRIDRNHCAFLDTVAPGPTHRKLLAYNTFFGAHSHGTHVACTLAGDAGADDDNRGVAYESKMVFNYLPTFDEDAVTSFFELHHDQGARIHTNSWGNDSSTFYDSLARGIDVFTHEHEDDLVLFAVTNAGNLRNPENAKNLIAVAASYDAPDLGFHCSGGSGPTNDGRRKPEIYAPGCSTNSALASSSSSPHCSTFPQTGSSMAAPVIAAAAALTRQYYMMGYYPTGTSQEADEFIPSAALLKATLLNGTRDMNGLPDYPGDLEGWGHVMLNDALHFPGETRKLLVLDDRRNSAGLMTTDVETYDFEVTDPTELLRLTLVWTEPPAAAGSANAVVNDLDLELVDPLGTVYLGNVFFAGRSISGGARDDKNNVEQILIELPLVGTWQARVKGVSVAVSTQGYALIVTGGVQQSVAVSGACCTSESCTDVAGSTACEMFVCNVADHLPGSFTGCYGDADGNGLVNAGDRGFISAAIGSTSDVAVCLHDMDGNGIINAADRGFVSAAIGLCEALPDWQNGSGQNHGVPDTRFGSGYMGDGTACAAVECP
jgi:subtilisin family serine protease